jgi:peptidoglycan/xylan/chitin deacetylase (PgdA/CDA1 family)
LRSWALGGVAFLALLGAVSPLAATSLGARDAAAASVTTVVSLTFDDERASQATALTIVAAHGMRATFYVNSGTIGQAGRLTWDQLAQAAAAGHEVAGHTIDHVHLPQVGATEAKRQICDDRGRLMERGFVVTDFAYPFGEGFDDATVRSLVQQCGYNSARRAWGLRDSTCGSCPAAEPIPPADRWAVRTPNGIRNRDRLRYIEGLVTQAEQSGGGWVPLLFHDVCSGCGDEWAISPDDFQAFLDWLQPRAASGTVVKTVAQVIGGSVQAAPPPDSTPPTSSISCNGAPCSTNWYAGAVQVTLSATDDWSGVAAIRYTTNGSDPTSSSTLYSGPFTVSTSATVKYRAWDNEGNAETTRSQSMRIDADPPTVAITSLSGSATVDGTVRLEATASDADSGVARVTYFLDSSSIGSSTNSPYRITWNTRKAPKGQHTLTAVAADRAGNEATSAPVIVTIG